MSHSFLSASQSARELPAVGMERISGGCDPRESYICA